VATRNIVANEEILLVSTEKCITGLELVGCGRTLSFDINKKLETIAKKYYEHNLPQLYYLQNLLKIVF
jgi:hypothetical protein